jgi:hypothetical protein
MIDKYQKQGTVSSSSMEHKLNIDGYLTEQGCIGKRKPTAKTTDGKGTYLRDELKIWQKLGLLEMRTKTQYFFPGEGFRFNWDRITKLLISGF